MSVLAGRSRILSKNGVFQMETHALRVVRRTIVAALVAAGVFSILSAMADNMAYMAVYPGSDFGTIDLDTGVFTLLGNSGQTLAGLGVINGTLYATSLQGTNPGSLYTVNPANGSLTLVGNSGIAYDQFGSTTQGLFAIGSDGNFYSINPTAGAATLIGPLNISLGGWRNLSCNASALYDTEGANLYTINTTTGVATLVGNMGGPNVAAIVFENGVLYGGQEAPGAHVDILDPNTGVATVGPTLTGASNVFGGLAPYPLTAPPTVGQIFVTNNGTGSAGTGTASEYTTDGATVNASQVTGLGNNPTGIAVSGNYLFILDLNGGKIGEYDATTGAVINASLVTGLNGPASIAVSNDGTNLFVTTLFNGDENIGKYTLGATPGTVTASNPSFVTGLQNPAGIAVSGSNLFVANSSPATVGGTVGVGEYDATTGATINASLITTGIPGPSAIAVSGTTLYVAYNQDRIGQYTLGATPGTIASSNPTLVTGLHSPAVAVFQGHLFVTNFMSGAPSGVVGEYDANTGAAVNASLITLTKYPEAIAVATAPVTSATLKITSITHPASNTIHLLGIGAPYAVNRIESSSVPSSTGFTTLGSVTTNASGAIAYDDTSAGTKKFYRLAYP